MNKKVLSTSVDERPKIVDERTTVGDWEGDLIKGQRTVNEPALMTLNGRLSRHEIIVKIPNYHADTCRDVLQKIINDCEPEKFHSVTFDNSSNFALPAQVEGLCSSSCALGTW